MPEFAAEHTRKALEPFAMVAQAERAGDDADLARIGAEAAQQRGRGASRRLVVDADEVPAARTGKVRHQRHDRHAAPGRRIDRLDHGRIVRRDDHRAIGLARIEGIQPGDKCRRVERMIGGRRECQPLVAGGADAPPDRGDEALHEGIAAVGDEKAHAQVARPGEQRRRQIAAEIERLDRRFDLFGGFGPYAGPGIEHAVDRRERNARGPRHVMHGCPLVVLSLVHRPLRTAAKMARGYRRRQLESTPRGLVRDPICRYIGRRHPDGESKMVAVKPFGTFEGKRVDQFTLTSASGVEVDIINWGVVVRDWRVPVKGGLRSVVLGFDSFDHYPTHSPYFGAIAGRVANRIAGGRFELGGKTYTVTPNEGANSLHGGPRGLSRLVWDAAPDDATNSVVFSIESANGDSGYPGHVRIKATYRLEGNTLRLELGATTDKPTPLSLVQHQYFNLGTSPDVLDHTYWFAAGAYTEVDPVSLIPTGNIIEARPGTQWNFRTPRNLRDTGGNPIDYDGNLVLDTGRDLREPAGIVKSPDGDLTLKLWTDRPGVQFYDSVMMGKLEGIGRGGATYGKYAGFCVEDQAFPDAVNHPHFPDVIVTPDRPYAHWCEIEIA